MRLQRVLFIRKSVLAYQRYLSRWRALGGGVRLDRFSTMADYPNKASPAMLQIDNLVFSYPKHPVITGLCATIPPGVTFVRGGDGRGKTTLLSLLAGTSKPDSGELQINGISLQGQRATYRAQVFCVDPRTEEFDQITPTEFFDLQRAVFPTFDFGIIPDLVDGLDLRLHIDKKLYMLSTGSKRKVFLAAAFASGAAVTLMDMPFAAVDKTSSGFIVALLQRASSHRSRVFVFADYEAPAGLTLGGVIDLGD